MLNALSIDVEGFVESNLQSFTVPPGFVDARAEVYEIERNMAETLHLLDELNIRATFFFLGTVAERIPRLVIQTADLGHEIGSHSFQHVRVFGQTPEEFERGLSSSKQALEDLSGKEVVGFRAPDFSITRSSLWALDVLQEVGFIYDSSIYPTDMHDVYGIPGASGGIHCLPNGLVEFPLSTVEIFGRRVPFGGGGYHRFYPVDVTRRCIRSQNQKGRPCMFYIHPYEVGPVLPRIPGLSPARRARHYFRAREGGARLARVLRSFRFGPAIDVLRQHGLAEL